MACDVRSAAVPKTMMLVTNSANSEVDSAASVKREKKSRETRLRNCCIPGFRGGGVSCSLHNRY